MRLFYTLTNDNKDNLENLLKQIIGDKYYQIRDDQLFVNESELSVKLMCTRNSYEKRRYLKEFGFKEVEMRV